MIDVTTLQQQTALPYYHVEEKSLKSMGLPPLDFWDWYAQWCEEEGLFNDRASYQE